MKLEENNYQETRLAELLMSEIYETGGRRYYGIHGTLTKDFAEGILRDGIVTMHAGDLGRTCWAMSDNPEVAARILLNYEHRQPLKFLVIVSYKSGLRDHQVIEEDVPELVARAEPGFESYNTHIHRVPPQFIKGYFDVEQMIFVKNPLYSSSAEAVTVRKSRFPVSPYVEVSPSLGNTPISNESALDDDPDWNF